MPSDLEKDALGNDATFDLEKFFKVAQGSPLGKEWHDCENVYDILRLRYDESGKRIRTYKEIGELLNVCWERVRQKISKSMRMMRHPHRRSKYMQG